MSPLVVREMVSSSFKKSSLLSLNDNEMLRSMVSVAMTIPKRHSIVVRDSHAVRYVGASTHASVFAFLRQSEALRIFGISVVLTATMWSIVSYANVEARVALLLMP